MTSYEWAFVAAGCVGCFVAVFHGVIMQKKMIPPILSTIRLPETTHRLVPFLLHFSTLCWFLGGAALIAVTLYASSLVILTTAAFVGAFYTFGAVGNFWGTRGKHPGWMLLAVAVTLIAYGVSQIVS
ncbi:hypothetical protein [Kordiimonas aquimaris]|uniref:hypothetical protein n=1 Tax=Kordiimonas aquimaris TaxID=707591 RepID=UPI0021D35DDC|nr:hypothetical protein [Kordiimonas aquimaris]